jgi:hypothetical protein
LEQEVGFSLPEAYQQYLLWMGRDYDGVLRGTDCFINDAIHNTDYLPELLAENNIQFDLSAHYLVFYGHQGYVAAWFELPKIAENPIVWFFIEAEDVQLPSPGGTFTDFILNDVKGMAQFLPRTRRRRNDF